MLITISGLSGSGKSSAAKGLSEKLGIPTVDVGKIFRALAAKHGMDVVAFGTYVEKHPDIDRELDAAMIRRAKRSRNLILQSRLAGHMSARENLDAVRIWIAASPKVRAERVARREGCSYKEAHAEVTRRDKDNRNRYLKTYGLDLNDLSIYDIVVQTNDSSKEEVISRLVKELTRIWPKKRKMQSRKRKISRPLRPKRPLRKR
jgi:predicted cytidylate kinase